MSSPTLDYFRATSPSASGLSDDELTLKIYDLTRGNPVYDEDQEFVAKAKSLDLYRAAGTAVRNVGRGFTGGAGGLASSIGIPLERFTDVTGINPAGLPGVPLSGSQFQAIGHAVRDIVAPPDPNAPTGFWRTDLPNAAGSMGFFMAGGAAGKLAKIPAMLTTGLLGAGVQGAQGYDEAIASGASKGTAFTSYALNLPLGATEILPLAKILDRFDKHLAGTLSKHIFEAFKEGSTEGLQELGQQLGGNVVARQLYDENRELFDGAASGGAAGGILGFAASMIVSAMGGHLKPPPAQGEPPPILKPPVLPPPIPPASAPFVAPVPPPGPPPNAPVAASKIGETPANVNLEDFTAENARRLAAQESPKQPVNPEDLGLIVADYLKRLRQIPNPNETQANRLKMIGAIAQNPTSASAENLAALFNLTLDPDATEMPKAFSFIERPTPLDSGGMLPGDTGIGMRAERRLMTQTQDQALASARRAASVMGVGPIVEAPQEPVVISAPAAPAVAQVSTPTEFSERLSPTDGLNLKGATPVKFSDVTGVKKTKNDEGETVYAIRYGSEGQYLGYSDNPIWESHDKFGQGFGQSAASRTEPENRPDALEPLTIEALEPIAVKYANPSSHGSNAEIELIDNLEATQPELYKAFNKRVREIRAANTRDANASRVQKEVIAEEKPKAVEAVGKLTEPEKIVSATVKFAGVPTVYEAPTHGQAYEKALAAHPELEGEKIFEAFKTNTGRIVSRKEASKITGVDSVQGELDAQDVKLEVKPAQEALPAAQAAVAKIGDPLKVMGVDSVLAKSETTQDGVRYDLFSGAKLKENRAAIRAIDVDSGNVISLTQFPTFDAAESKFNETVALASGTKPSKPETIPVVNESLTTETRAASPPELAAEKAVVAQTELTGVDGDRVIRGKPDTFRTWQEYDAWLSKQPDAFLLHALKEQAESESRRILEESTGQRPRLDDDSKRMNRINVGSVYREAVRRGLDVPKISVLARYAGVELPEKAASTKPVQLSSPTELVADKPASEGVGSVYQSTHNGKPVWLVQEGLKRGFGDSIWQSEQEANGQSKLVAMRESSESTDADAVEDSSIPQLTSERPEWVTIPRFEKMVKRQRRMLSDEAFLATDAKKRGMTDLKSERERVARELPTNEQTLHELYSEQGLKIPSDSVLSEGYEAKFRDLSGVSAPGLTSATVETKLWNSVLDAIRMAGIPVQVLNTALGNVQDQFRAYENGDRLIVVGMNHLMGPTIENLAGLLHEGGHALWSKLSHEIQTRLERALGNPAITRSGNRVVSPAEETIVENTAQAMIQEGFNPAEARGFAQQLWRFVKDVVLRLTMAVQESLLGKSSQRMAEAYFQNQMESWLAGDVRPYSVIQFLGGGRPRPEHIAASLTPSNGSGLLLAQWDPDEQKMVYQDVLIDGLPALAYTAKYMWKGDVTGPIPVVSETNAVADQQPMVASTNEVSVALETAFNAWTNRGGNRTSAGPPLFNTFQEFFEQFLQPTDYPTFPATLIQAINDELGKVGAGAVYPALRVSGIADEYGKLRAATNALTLLRNISAGMGSRRQESETESESNTREIKRTAKQINRAATNYTNVSEVVNDANEDLEDIFVRFKDDIKTVGKTSAQVSELGQQILDLIGQSDNPLERLRQYSGAIEQLYKRISGNQHNDFVDMLRAVANLHLPWDLTATQLKPMVETAIRNNPLFAPLRSAEDRNALMGILITFAKRNGIVLDFLQLSAVEKGTERDTINEMLKAAVEDSKTALAKARGLLNRLTKNQLFAGKLLDRIEKMRASNFELVQRNLTLNRFVEFHDQDLVPAMQAQMRPLEQLLGAESIAPHNLSWEPVNGATLQVALNPNSTLEEVMAKTSTQTLNLQAGQRITSDIEFIMKHNQAWLDRYALDHPGEKGVVWNDMNLRLQKLKMLGIDPEIRKVKGSFVIDMLGSIKDKLDRIGLPVTRELSKRLGWLDILRLQHHRDTVVIGTKWDNGEKIAFNEANRTVRTPFTVDTFRRVFFHPALKLAEDRKDITASTATVEQDENETLKAIRNLFLSNPDTRAMLNRNSNLWPALEKFYRAHWKYGVEGSFKVLNAMARTVGNPSGAMIQDDVLGLNRKPIGSQIHTSPRTFRKTIRTLYDAMLPLWQDGYVKKPAELEKLSAALAAEYDADPAAMATRVQEMFAAPNVWKFFVKEIVNMPRSQFYAPKRADGTSPVAKRMNVLASYQTANGDVLAFINALAQSESGQPATAEFIGETLSTFHAFFNIVHGIFVDLDKARDNRLDNVTSPDGSDIDHFLMDARTSEALPAGFMEYATFSAYDMQRIFQRFAEHAAFGKDAGAVWSLFNTADVEMKALIERFEELKGKADTEGRTNKERDDLLTASFGSKAAREFAEQAAKNIGILSSAKIDFENVIKSQATTMVQLKALNELMGISPMLALQGAGTAFMDFISHFQPLRVLGVSSQGFQMTADMSKATAARIFGSLLQVFGIQWGAQAEKNRILYDEGFSDPDGILSLKEKLISIVHSTNTRQDINHASKAVIIFSRAVKAMLSTGVPQIFKTNDQLYPTLKPALFTYGSQVMQGGAMIGVIDGYELMIAKAVRFFRNNPGLADNPKFRFSAADLGYKKGWVLNDEFAFDVMRDGFERQGIGSLETVSRGTIRRQDAAPTGTKVPVMTREQIQKIALIGPNEIMQDATLSNRASWSVTNPILKTMTTLLGWSLTNFKNVQMAFREPGGESSYRAARKGLVAFAALIPIGIAFAMLRDEYDERVLGKKSNVLGLGQGKDTLAVIDMLDRAGTFGIGGNLANSLVNQDINREFSLDSRVFFASSILNTGRALSNWVRQDAATWSSVYRPLLNGLGGSGFLQYADAINNALSLDNAESRAVARISTNNYLRAVGRGLDMDVRIGRSSGVISNTVKPWVSEMLMAAYANDMQAFSEAYRNAVEAAREAKFPDPADHVKRSYTAINPLRIVYQTMPLAAEYRRILNALTPNGRDAVQESMILYNRFGERIGVKPSFGREEKPPSLNMASVRSRAALAFSGF